MKKAFIGIFVFIVTFNTFAAMGGINIYFLKSVNVTGRSAPEDVCLIDCTWGHFLILADGSSLSDYMAAGFMKYQNTNASVNLYAQTNTSIYYTGTGNGTTTFPPSFNYVLLTACDFIDNDLNP